VAYFMARMIPAAPGRTALQRAPPATSAISVQAGVIPFDFTRYLSTTSCA
jgi:hypothetical protein